MSEQTSNIRTRIAAIRKELDELEAENDVKVDPYDEKARAITIKFMTDSPARASASLVEETLEELPLAIAQALREETRRLLPWAKHIEYEGWPCTPEACYCGLRTALEGK